MLDEFTCKNIDMIVERVLKEARLNQPPIHIENLLSHLEIDRDFYNLEDPGLIRRIQHRIKIYGHRYGHGLITLQRHLAIFLAFSSFYGRDKRGGFSVESIVPGLWPFQCRKPVMGE